MLNYSSTLKQTHEWYQDDFISKHLFILTIILTKNLLEEEDKLYSDKQQTIIRYQNYEQKDFMIAKDS